MSIQSEIARLQTAKTNLATAIASKGVTVPDTATLDDYPELVNSIQIGTTSDPLAGKTVFMMGDSLMYGLGWAGGYKNCLEEQHPNTTFYNFGVNGAALADTSGQAQIIILQMMNNQSIFSQSDIVIFNGGGNDLGLGVPLGSMPTNFDNVVEGYILGELYPAFQQYCHSLRLLAPEKDLYYIVPQVYGTFNNISTEKQNLVLENFIKICQFYSVRVIDLRSNAGFCTAVPATNNPYMYDTLHPNEAGYRKMAPYINNRIMRYY